MTFKERFPSYEKIVWAVNTCDKQLFSYRNNLQPVIPEDVVKKYLKVHRIAKSKVKEAIDKYIVERKSGVRYGAPINPFKLKKELL